MLEISRDIGGQIHQGFAGDTLNTAVYLSRLLSRDEYEIHYFTAIGTDFLSDEMVRYLVGEGLVCDTIRRFTNKHLGLYWIDIDATGERSFTYWRDESAARDLLNGQEYDAQLASLLTMDYIYLSGISLAILPQHGREKLHEVLSNARASGSKICFDNNYRPRLWNNVDTAQGWHRKILQITDIAFLTYEDECFLWGDTHPDQSLLRSRFLGVAETVLKRGAEACLIETHTGSYRAEAVDLASNKIVDTTGAGDSFSAGYLAERLKGQDCPINCASSGHQLASKVVQQRGAIIPSAPM